MCEFDAERAELFFSRAVILVEGMTEKIALPFVFNALGHDPDREQISIVECGGKANMPMFVEICRRARIPYVVVHDSDRGRTRADRVGGEAERPHPPPGGRAAHHCPRARLRGRRRLRSRRRKPERAWSSPRPREPDELPPPLVRAVELAVASARPGAPTYS